MPTLLVGLVKFWLMLAVYKRLQTTTIFNYYWVKNAAALVVAALISFPTFVFNVPTHNIFAAYKPYYHWLPAISVQTNWAFMHLLTSYYWVVLAYITTLVNNAHRWDTTYSKFISLIYKHLAYFLHFSSFFICTPYNFEL